MAVLSIMSDRPGRAVIYGIFDPLITLSLAASLVAMCSGTHGVITWSGRFDLIDELSIGVAVLFSSPTVTV